MNFYGYWTVGYTISLGIILEMWIFTLCNTIIIQFQPKFFNFTLKFIIFVRNMTFSFLKKNLWSILLTENITLNNFLMKITLVLMFKHS